MTMTRISSDQFLSALRQQLERCTAAIAMQMRDLDAYAHMLHAISNKTDKQKEDLKLVIERKNDLAALDAELRFTYLSDIAKLMQVEELIKQLDSFSEDLETEAKRPEKLNESIKTAGAMIKLGKGAIDVAEAFGASP